MMKSIRPHLFRWIAQILGFAAATLPLVASDRRPPAVLAEALCGLAAMLAMSKRRWRFASAVWFGARSFVAIGQMAFSPAHASIHMIAALLGVGAAVAILWPSLDAEREDDPLPSLPGSWALLSALVVTVVDSTLGSVLSAHSRSLEEATFACGAGSLTLFATFAFASRLGWARWPMQLAGAGLAALFATIATDGFGSSDPTLIAGLGIRPGTLMQWLVSLAVALGFDWLRSPTTSGRRFVRAACFVFAAEMIPVVAADPASARHGLLIALARAAAFGVAIASTTRRAGVKRPSTHVRALGGVPPGHIILALFLAPPVVAASAAVILHSDPWVPVEAAAIAGFLASAAILIRARFIRALLWIGAAIPLLVLSLKAAAESSRGGGLVGMPLLACMGLALVSRFLSSATVGRHTVRRWHLPIRPAVRFGRMTTVPLMVSMAAAALVVARLQPNARGDLLATATGPIPLKKPVFFQPPTLTDPSESGGTGATVAADPLGRGTWVVDEELNAIALVSPSGTRKSVPVDGWPERLVVDRRGHVFVSCREADVVDDIAPDFSVRRISVGTEPRALAIDESGGLLYVGLVTERTVAAIDIASGRVVATHRLEADPWEIALTPDGLAVLPERGGAVEFLSRDLAMKHDVPLLVNGDRQAWHGQALVAAGKDLIVVHAAVNTGLSQPVPSGGYGGGQREPLEYMVSLIRDGKPVVFPSSLESTRVLTGVAEITGAAISKGELILASRGTASLVAFSLDDLGRRTPVLRKLNAVHGATGVAASCDGVVRTVAAFDRELVSSNRGLSSATRETLGKGRLDTEMALGRRLFHDANNRSIAAGTMACAVCHPDGREDGLVWRLQGTRRQTPMLADRLVDTAPYNWQGSEPTLEGNLAQTVKRLGGTGLATDEVDALARFVREGLRPAHQPAVADHEMVALGRRIFHDDRVGCAACHEGTSSTDGALHDVGTMSARELAEMQVTGSLSQPVSFDTPSLRHVALTAPYFHDGSQPSLEALLLNNHDRMGRTNHLSSQERRALAAYLRTL